MTNQKKEVRQDILDKLDNSIVFAEQPDKKYLDMVFDMMRYEGEPGFFNEEEASRRRPNAVGTNPCG